MSALTPQRLEIAAWLATCAALAAGIGQQTDWGQRWHLPAQEAMAVDGEFKAPPLSPAFVVPPTDRFLEVTLRPLWLPDRAVPPPTTQPQVAQTPLKDRYILTGTMVTPIGGFATLVDKTGNRSRSVSEGDEIAKGIVLLDVFDNKVVLQQGESVETIIIQTGGVAPAAPARRAAPAVKPADANTAPTQAAGTASPPDPSGMPAADAQDAKPAATAAAEPKAKRPRIPFPWEAPPAAPSGNQKQ